MKLKWLKQQKPVTHADKALEYIEKALALVRQRATADPEHGAYPYLIPQIEYVKSVLTEPNTDRTKLHEINLGGGGPRSDILKEQDSELYEKLAEVTYIAAQIRRGLKIDLKVLEESL